MKTFTRVKLIFLLVLSLFLLYRTQLTISEAAPANEKALNRYKIHVDMSSPKDARPIAQWLTKNGFDIAGMNWRKGEIEVITSDKGVKFIEEHAFIRGDHFDFFSDLPSIINGALDSVVGKTSGENGNDKKAA